MTDKAKSTIQIWLEHIFRLIVTGAITLAFFTVPNFMADVKGLSFSSIETKVNTEKHVENSLSELELHQLSQHVGNPDFHMPKFQKDSVYLLRSEHDAYVKKTQETIDRMAITNYQMKQEISEIHSLLKAINRRMPN